MVVYEDLLVDGSIPVELDDGRDDSRWARQLWKPAAIATEIADLSAIYDKLPGRFPPLYEQLVLSYRWLEVDLPEFARLLANSPGPALAALLSNITADPTLVDVLFPLRLIPFGKASGSNYDPLCFDLARRRPDGDCPVVQVEHESVLCNDQVGDVWQLFDSFRGLVEAVIAEAEKDDHTSNHQQHVPASRIRA
jgi:hypothetical protein